MYFWVMRNDLITGRSQRNGAFEREANITTSITSATWHGIDYSPSRKNLKNIEKIDAVIKETDRKHKGKIEYLTVKEAGRRI